MSEHVLEREQVVPGPVDDVFAFFAQARNLERITPPWLRFEVLMPEPIAMGAGTLIEYRLRVRGVPLRWVSNEFAPCADGTVVRDRVRYALPLGRAGGLAHAAFVRRDLERIFDYRRAAVLLAMGGRAPRSAVA